MLGHGQGVAQLPLQVPYLPFVAGMLPCCPKDLKMAQLTSGDLIVLLESFFWHKAQSLSAKLPKYNSSFGCLGPVLREFDVFKECLHGSHAGQDGRYDGAPFAPFHRQIEPGESM